MDRITQEAYYRQRVLKYAADTRKLPPKLWLPLTKGRGCIYNILLV